MALTDGLDLIDPHSYERQGTPHASFAELRRSSPIHHCRPKGFGEFWAITKHADICEISKQPNLFLNAPGIVVLNDSVDMVEAALTQMVFFEEESCGQCSPCRIGTQILRQAIERLRGGDRDALAYVQEVAWGMREASICGLGQAASIPLASAMQYFPEEFGLAAGGSG